MKVSFCICISLSMTALFAQAKDQERKPAATGEAFCAHVAGSRGAHDLVHSGCNPEKSISIATSILSKSVAGLSAGEDHYVVCCVQK